MSVSWLPGSTATAGGGGFAEDLNCSLGAGASYGPPDLPAPVTLAECFGHCRADPKCDAVRVNWFTIPGNWTAVKVGCGLRGGVDLAKCTVQTPVYHPSAHTVQYANHLPLNCFTTSHLVQSSVNNQVISQSIWTSSDLCRYSTFALDAPNKTQLVIAASEPTIIEPIPVVR